MVPSINNRELASCIWVLVFIGFCLFKSSIRNSVFGLLKLLFSKNISLMIAIMIAYVALTIFALYRIHFWNTSLLKDSVVWLIGVGFVMLMNVNKAIKEESHFIEIIKENVRLTLIVEFIINLYVFSLPVELLLIPFITLLVLIQLVSKRDEKHKSVTTFLNNILGLIGTAILCYAGYKLFSDFKSFAIIDNLRSFLYPIFLTLCYIPFVYIIALFILYEEFFIAINRAFQHKRQLGRYAKWQVFKTANISLSTARLLRKNLNVFTINSKEDLEKAMFKIQISKSIIQS